MDEWTTISDVREYSKVKDDIWQQFAAALGDETLDDILTF